MKCVDRSGGGWEGISDVKMTIFRITHFDGYLRPSWPPSEDGLLSEDGHQIHI